MNNLGIILMAGDGKRFSNKGYSIPKPFLEVNSIPMFILAAKSIPLANKYIFICKKEHADKYDLNKIIKRYFNKFVLIFVSKTTQGQASTCLLAESIINKDDIITICPCDSFYKYNKNIFENKLKESDALIWSFKHNSTLKHPEMFGWIRLDKDKVIEVKCKETVSLNPKNDNSVVGTFTFSRKKILMDSIQSMINKERTINNEYYLDISIDEAIKLGFKVSMIKTKSFYSFGTPEDYEKNKKIKTFA